MKEAKQFLQKSLDLLEQRGSEYSQTDKKEERSFAAVASIFNSKTGKYITPAEVCLILQDLKDVRQWSQDRLHIDSVEDCVSYAALKAEELTKQYGYEELEIITTPYKPSVMEDWAAMTKR
jgi:hypothetical protein